MSVKEQTACKSKRKDDNSKSSHHDIHRPFPKASRWKKKKEEPPRVDRHRARTPYRYYPIPLMRSRVPAQFNREKTIENPPRRSLVRFIRFASFFRRPAPAHMPTRARLMTPCSSAPYQPLFPRFVALFFFSIPFSPVYAGFLFVSGARERGFRV